LPFKIQPAALHRGAMGLARLTHHPSDVKGAGAHIAKVTGSKRTVAAAGGVEALDGMIRRATVGYATSSLAVKACQERGDSAREAEEAAAEAAAVVEAAGGKDKVSKEQRLAASMAAAEAEEATRDAEAAVKESSEAEEQIGSNATALIYALSAVLNMSVIPKNQIRIAKRSMWLLLRIRATFSEIVVAASAAGEGVETSAQKIAELSSRALRNVSRNENNRTTIYKAKFKLALICGFTGSLPLAAGYGDEGRAGVDCGPESGGPNGLPSLGLELLMPGKGSGAAAGDDDEEEEEEEEEELDDFDDVAGGGGGEDASAGLGGGLSASFKGDTGGLQQRPSSGRRSFLKWAADEFGVRGGDTFNPNLNADITGRMGEEASFISATAGGSSSWSVHDPLYSSMRTSQDVKHVASVNASMQSTMSLVTFRKNVYNKKDASAAMKKARMVCDTARSVLCQPDRDMWETSRSAAARPITAPGTHAPPPMHTTLRWHPPVLEYLQEALPAGDDKDTEDDKRAVSARTSSGSKPGSASAGSKHGSAVKEKTKKSGGSGSGLSASGRLLTARRPIVAAERLARDSATVKSLDAMGTLHINGGQRDRPATAAVERPRTSAADFKRRTEMRSASQSRSKAALMKSANEAMQTAGYLSNAAATRWGCTSYNRLKP
jgi:hypothetical protein